MTWRAGGGGLLTPWGAAAPPLPAAPLGAGGRGGRHVLLLLLPASGLTAPSAAALEPMGESLIGAASLDLPPLGAAGATGGAGAAGSRDGALPAFPSPPAFPMPLGLPPTQAFPMCPALLAENAPGCDGAGRPLAHSWSDRRRRQSADLAGGRRASLPGAAFR